MHARDSADAGKTPNLHLTSFLNRGEMEAEADNISARPPDLSPWPQTTTLPAIVIILLFRYFGISSSQVDIGLLSKRESDQWMLKLSS